MAQILLSRAPQSVDLDWHVRGAPFTDESHVVVEAITLNGRVYRVEHAVATCDELATFVVSFVERDLDAHPPVSLALLVSFFPDIGSTPAVTFGSGFGLQLDVDRFAFIVQASFALPQSGPIALGSETTLSSSSLLGSLLACGRAVPRTRAQELSLDLCGGFSAGTAFGTFSSQPGLEVAGIFELSAAALFRVALVGPFDFLASAGLDVPIVRPAFSAPSPDGRSVLASEVVVGRVQIGCAIKI